MSKGRHFRIAVVEAVALLACAIVLAAVYNHFSGKGIPWVAAARAIPYAADNTLALDMKSEAPSPGPQRLTLAQAYTLHANRKAIFLDAREEERYGAGHLAGAIHFPYDHRDGWDQLLKNLSPKATLVAYCDDDCDSALRLGEALSEMGYKRIYVMEVGYDSWRNAGYPVELGK